MTSKQNLLLQLLVLFISVFLIFSCKKVVDPPNEHNYSLVNQPTSSSISEVNSDVSSTCYEPLQPDWNNDTVHVPTILGTRLMNNPYSVSIMQQASINLYGHASGIGINKRYIRFKPADDIQLEQLDSLDLDLYDYPLDYEVIQEGDYYDQGLPAEENPWYYTVVDPSFIPPSGIRYEVLADLYVPDDDIYLEDEAFRITGNVVDSLECGEQTNLSSMPEFRDRFLQENGLNSNVIDLFTQYHY